MRGKRRAVLESVSRGEGLSDHHHADDDGWAAHGSGDVLRKRDGAGETLIWKYRGRSALPPERLINVGGVPSPRVAFCGVRASRPHPGVAGAGKEKGRIRR